MKRFYSILAIFALLFSVNLNIFAENIEQAEREDWRAYIKEKLPLIICVGSKTKQCYRAAVLAVESCLDISNDQIPTVLQMPSDGYRIGGIISKCSRNLVATLIKTANVIENSNQE